jgi:hypothetical protein
MPVAFTDKNEQEMLTLALASYQGAWLPHLEEAGRAPSEGAIVRALDALAPLGKRWKLAWGPVALRSTFGPLDDVLAFVAKAEGDPARYAVVLRGTNPLSGTDWIFGDGWVLFDEPWNGSETARISRSCALGLAVVQNLRSAPGPRRGWVGSIVDAERAIVAGATRLLQDVKTTVTGNAGGDVHHDASEDAWLHSAGARIMDAASRVGRRAENALDALESAAEAVAHGGLKAFDDVAYKHAVEALRLRGEGAGGGAVTLADFLKADAGGKKIDVWVTGHSKGAALATAVAMWLEESRDVWAPPAGAELHCTTFAGPTVGNEAFARRVAAVLGGRHRRVANGFDLVTQGWSFADLEHAISRAEPVTRAAVLPVLRAIAGAVQPLRYEQVDDPAGHFEGGDGLRWGGPLGQMIHQHLHAYIVNAGLDPGDFGLPRFEPPKAP